MTIPLPLALSAFLVLATFLYACWQDVKTRTIYAVTWYPAAVGCGVLVIWFWIEFFSAPWGVYVLGTSVFIALLMFLFTYLSLFGVADGKAMILLSLAVPITPFADWIFPSLALSSLVNGAVFALIVPVVFLIRNLALKNKAPFWLMCSGKPVPGDSITNYFGFVSEDITEENGVISRKFCRAHSSIRALKTQSGLSIRNLREDPKTYAKELSLYAKAGDVWISYGVPFMIPITIGYIFALFGFSLVDMVLGMLIL
ncbi:A24 family peptidase C-terminal domain-containing protein [uncultured Methanocorpusculum sp.]|nr:A24 family peptidase C-terminal domain-containing protein [uncultured Methanocorpusculum sp.]